MSSFKIGKEVVSLVNGIETNLKKGQHYTITDIDVCSCGLVSLNVDNMQNSCGHLHTYCDCGISKPLNAPKKFIRSSVFRLIDENYAENLLSELTAEHLQEEKIRKEIERQPLKQKLFELTNPVDNPPKTL